MSRNELASWMQVAIGLAGLILVLLGGGPIIDSATAKGGDTSVSVQTILLLSVLAIIVVISMGLTAVGSAVLVKAAFKQMGSRHPTHGAFSFVICLFGLAGSIVLAFLGNPFWFASFTFACLFLLATFAAAKTEEIDGFWLTIIAGLFFATTISGIGVGAGFALQTSDTSEETSKVGN